MEIDIYKSIKNGNKYPSVPSQTDIEQLLLPGDTDPDILTLSPFKTSIKLDPSIPRIALDQEDIIMQINTKGFAIHAAKVTFNIKTK